MKKFVQKMLIIAVAIFLLGTLAPLVGSAVEMRNAENLVVEPEFQIEIKFSTINV
jgi:hypothetical protein